MLDVLRVFLEQQQLLALFLVVGLGYALGGINIRGFALGAGAVLFVGLATGMLSPKAAPPGLVGSLGLVLFVYGIGIQYGKQVVSGVTSPFGLKLNALVLLSHLAGIGVCWVGYAGFSVAPAAVAGLFCGALTSTPALQAAISAAGNNDPALGYSVAYPFGFIAPILCMYFANVWLTRKVMTPAGAALELREVVVRNPRIAGRPLLVGHFLLKLRFDELLGTTCGVAANPAQMVFASKLTASDRTDVAYAMTFPTGTIMKILLLQVMLAMMGSQ